MGFPSAGKGGSFAPGALRDWLSCKDTQCQPRASSGPVFCLGQDL